jgi:hypothetical protein
MKNSDQNVAKIGPVLRRSLVPALVRNGFLGFQRFLVGPCWMPEKIRRIQDGHRGGALDLLASFFLLGESVSCEDLAKYLSIEALGALKLLPFAVVTDDRICIQDYRLCLYQNIIFFCQISADPDVYFGDDSHALASAITALEFHPDEIETGLDLCAGSGIQGMLLAKICKRVFIVEINPNAAAVAQINLGLNGLDGRVQLFTGSCDDFFNCHANDKFGVVTFNPPLLPIPKTVRFPLVGDGGESGMVLTESILQRLEQGRRVTHALLCTGACIFRGGHTLPIELEQNSGGFGSLNFLLTSTRPLGVNSPVTKSFIRTVFLARAARKIQVDPLEGFADMLDMNSFYGDDSSEFATFLLIARNDVGNSRQQIDLTGLPNVFSYWYV